MSCDTALLDVENIITDDLYFGLIKKGVDKVKETTADTMPTMRNVFQYFTISSKMLKHELFEVALVAMYVNL
jgi:hypothetical protein